MLSFLNQWVGICHLFWKRFGHYFFKYFLHPIFSFLSFWNSKYIKPFNIALQFSDGCSLLFQYLLFFSTLCCTLVWMISVDFEFTDPFVSMSSILLSDSKEFFVSDTIFFSVQEFLCKHYFSMLNFFIWANVLPMFSFKSFNTFIYLSLCLPVPTSGIHWVCCYWQFFLLIVGHISCLYV